MITEDAARQYELGLLKTGKEAEVFLVERELGERRQLLAAKRYRKPAERTFRDDARYRGGRKTGDRRIDLAVAKGTLRGIEFRGAPVGRDRVRDARPAVVGRRVGAVSGATRQAPR